ncbi:MAG: hypothetical protein KAS58_05840, partial [Calditrichia bacterium]|nr:hypothetical protein [Calditrichia bacterium]
NPLPPFTKEESNRAIQYSRVTGYPLRSDQHREPGAEYRETRDERRAKLYKQFDEIKANINELSS